jgi:hypothetical protein
MAIKIHPKFPISRRQKVSEPIPASNANTEPVADVWCHQL